MVEKTITIAIDANVSRFKKAMADAKASVTKTGKGIKDDSEAMSANLRKVGEDIVPDVSGISDKMHKVLDDVSDVASDIERRLSETGESIKKDIEGINTGMGDVGGPDSLSEIIDVAEMASSSLDKVAESISDVKTSLVGIELPTDISAEGIGTVNLTPDVEMGDIPKVEKSIEIPIINIPDRVQTGLEEISDSASKTESRFAGIRRAGRGLFDGVLDSSKQARDTLNSIFSEISEKIKGFGKSGMLRDLMESLKGVSPVFDGILDTISDMGSRLKGAGKAGKLAMAGIGTAVGGLALGIGVMLGKAIMDTTGKLAKLADPARFDKANSEMKESVRELKTSLGELASPVFEYMAKGVSYLAKGLTWVVEKIAMLVGFLQGLLGLGHKTNQTLNGTADAMKEAGASADAGLASFDKLNALNVDEMGDMEQVDKMAGLMDKMRKAGEDSAKSIEGFFQPIYDLLHMDVGEVWVRFKESAKDAWENIKVWASEKWKAIKGAISGTWTSMVKWASDAWDAVKEWASEKWQEIKDKIKGTWSGMVQWASDAWENTKMKAKEIWDSITGWASDLWNSFTGWASDAWDTIKEKVVEIWDGFKNIVLGYWKIVGDSARAVWDGIKNFVLGVWETVFGFISNYIHTVGNIFKKVFTGAVNVFKTAWDKVFGGIKNAIQWVLDKVEWVMNKIDGMKNAVGNAVGKAKDWVGNKVEGVKNALGFAQGGVFQPNSPQIIKVGDNKSEPEALAPKSLIKEAVMEVFGEMGGASSKQNITLEIDGKVLARYMYDDLESVSRQKGRRTIA